MSFHIYQSNGAVSPPFYYSSLRDHFDPILSLTTLYQCGTRILDSFLILTTRLYQCPVRRSIFFTVLNTTIYFYNFNDPTVLLPYVMRGCFSLSCNLSDLDSFTSIFLFFVFLNIPRKGVCKSPAKAL